MSSSASKSGNNNHFNFQSFVCFCRQMAAISHSSVDRCIKLRLSTTAALVRRAHSGVELLEVVHLFHKLGLLAHRATSRPGPGGRPSIQKSENFQFT